MKIGLLFIFAAFMWSNSNAAPLITANDVAFAPTPTTAVAGSSVALSATPICTGFECIVAATTTAYGVSEVTFTGLTTSTGTRWALEYNCTQLTSAGGPYIKINKSQGGTTYINTTLLGTGNNGAASQTIGAADRCALNFSTSHRTNTGEQFFGFLRFYINPVTNGNAASLGELVQTTEGSDSGPGVNIPACRMSLGAAITAITFGVDAGAMQCDLWLSYRRTTNIN